MHISQEDMYEIRNRDFLKKVDHFKDCGEIKTKLLFGTPNVEKNFLTIIVPIYDHPEYLIIRAIKSIIYQECDFNYTILIIDDYTNSNRNDVILEYIKKLNDKRILFYRNERNLGVFANWNRGILLSNSEWITILHTDDFFKNNILDNMKCIIDANPQIDQLCCNYKMLKIKDEEIDINKEYVANQEKCWLRKVKYTEYFYEMKTSVKGSFYKKEKLVELGGFRSQGDGLGLDDYPLMLKFAYYYNTYLIESVLYLDSWGYNDSLNIKHWFPELIENYYMWIFFAKRIGGLKGYIYKKNAKYLLQKRAIEYDNGTSWVGVRVPIDMELLQKYCNVDFGTCRKAEEKLVSFLSRTFNFCYKHPLEKQRIELFEGKSIAELE